jgi:hypothetical protein
MWYVMSAGSKESVGGGEEIGPNPNKCEWCNRNM